jgi:hypothetical protein
MSRKGKSIEKESELMGSRDSGGGELGDETSLFWC